MTGLPRRRGPLVLVGGLVAVLVSLSGILVDDPGTRSAAEPAVPVRASQGIVVEYVPPVDAEVVDGFRMDEGPYGPGNRGLEYGTVGGEPVVATADGVVTFVGMVAGRLVVSLRHADGRLSSLTHMSTVTVSVGDGVGRGEPVGTAAVGLHFGVRENGVYLDPASLFGAPTGDPPGGVAYLVEP